MASQTDNGSVAKDIATGTAITLFIFAVTSYLPILGFFCALFIPLPTLFYRSKLGRQVGIIVPAAALFVMAAVMGGIAVDLVFFLELLLLGFMLGEFLAMNLSVEKTILYTCASVLLSGLLGLVLYSNVSNTGITLLVSQYIAMNLEMTMALYESMGVSEESLVQLSNSLEQIQYILVRIVPAMVIGSTLFVAWINLLLARRILAAKGMFFPDFGALNHWKAPDALIWVLIGCGGLLLIPGTSLKMLGLNGLLILFIVYFLQGIAVVSYYFEKKRFPRALRLFLYTLIAVQQFILLLVIGLGIFDMWLNFRKIKTDNHS
ncbi:MAG: YybS family protein [Thermodesulfobacteriota bacterium]